MEVKLKLKIKDIELELTTKEAEELYGVLKQLVGDKEMAIKIVERFRDYWPYWNYPKITFDEVPHYTNDYTVYSSDNIELKATTVGEE